MMGEILTGLSNKRTSQERVKTVTRTLAVDESRKVCCDALNGL